MDPSCDKRPNIYWFSQPDWWVLRASGAACRQWDHSVNLAIEVDEEADWVLGRVFPRALLWLSDALSKENQKSCGPLAYVMPFFFLFFPFFPPFNNRVIKCHNKIQTFLDKARFYFVKWVRRFWKKKIQFWRKNLISWNQVFLFCSCFCFTLAGLTLSQPIYPPFYVCSAVSAVESDMAW